MRWWWWCAVAACALYAASRGLRGRRAARGAVGSPLRTLPVMYWVHTRRYPDKYRNRDSCVEMPSLQTVEYAAPFWQRVTNSHAPPDAATAQVSTETLCHSAYWNQHQNDVRVLIHSELAPHSPNLYCHLWYYNSGSPISVRASVLFKDQMSCRPPSSGPPPAAVSVTNAGRCGAAFSMLAVQGTDAEQPWYNASSVGVCAVWRGAGGAAGPLPPADVAAWLLLLREFGVDMVYLYIIHAPSEVLSLLDRLSWSDDPLLHIIPYSSPPPSGKEEEEEEEGVRRDDMTPFNDCVYAARQRHGWLALLEMHELIVPLREHSLPALVSAHSSSESDEEVAVLEFPAAADYAEWLQRDREDAHGDHTRSAEDHPGSSRFLDRFWRDSHIASHEGVPGKLVHASRVSRVGREVSCVSARCAVRRVEGGAARLQRYGARCGAGAATRRDCRKTRARATRDDTLGARLGPGGAARVRDAVRRLIHDKLPYTHQDH